MTVNLERYREEKISNRGDLYIFESEYPSQNHPSALKDIVDCFECIGMFDGVTNN